MNELSGELAKMLIAGWEIHGFQSVQGTGGVTTGFAMLVQRGRDVAVVRLREENGQVALAGITKLTEGRA